MVARELSSGNGSDLSTSEVRWPPQVGDHVQIIMTGAPGVVMGVNDDRHFVVGIYSPVLHKVTTAPHRTFMLRELGPDTKSRSEDEPAAGAPRRRAKVLTPAE